MPKTKKQVEEVFLLDGTPSEKHFYDQIRDHIASRIPSLIHGPEYTAAQLCGKQFWQDIGRQKLAGKCIYHMVMSRSLPLVLAPTAHEYPRKYQLI